MEGYRVERVNKVHSFPSLLAQSPNKIKMLIPNSKLKAHLCSSRYLTINMFPLKWASLKTHLTLSDKVITSRY